MRNAVPYSVTLAPADDRRGPLPSAEYRLNRHVQDVLVLWPRLKSAAKFWIRSICLASTCLLITVSDDWTGDPTPTPASVDASLNGLDNDLALVAECASLAINHPADAVTPAKFALNMGQTFPAGMLPSLPQPKPIKRSRRKFRQPPSHVPDVLDEDVTRARATSKFWTASFDDYSSGAGPAS